MVELMKEPGSHLSMVQRKLTHAATHAEEAQIVLATSYLNVNRDEKKHPALFELPNPWDLDPNSDLSDAERADLEARLESVSAFPST